MPSLCLCLSISYVAQGLLAEQNHTDLQQTLGYSPLSLRLDFFLPPSLAYYQYSMIVIMMVTIAIISSRA